MMSLVRRWVSQPESIPLLCRWSQVGDTKISLLWGFKPPSSTPVLLRTRWADRNALRED